MRRIYRFTISSLLLIQLVIQPIAACKSPNFDDNSNVTSITDPNGQVQTIVRDLLDRVDTHSWRDSGGVERLKYKYSYDAEDNPYQTDETLNIGGPQRTFTEKRAFDARDRLTSTVDKFGHKVAFSYDRADNIRSISEFIVSVVAETDCFTRSSRKPEAYALFFNLHPARA